MLLLSLLLSLLLLCSWWCCLLSPLYYISETQVNSYCLHKSFKTISAHTHTIFPLLPFCNFDVITCYLLLLNGTQTLFMLLTTASWPVTVCTNHIISLNLFPHLQNQILNTHLLKKQDAIAVNSWNLGSNRSGLYF
jgi:hypothetical protein